LGLVILESGEDHGFIFKLFLKQRRIPRQ
jgi:hypothetical protein